MTKSIQYPSQVFWDEDDQGYVAIAPDLPGCSAFGKSEAKALKELRVAVELWISAAKSMGKSIPEPSKLPTPSAYSGKVLLRMAPSLHQKLAKEAQVEEVSLNHWIVTILSSGFKYHNPLSSQHEMALGYISTMSTSPKLVRAFGVVSSWETLGSAAFSSLDFVHPLGTVNYSAISAVEAYSESSDLMGLAHPVVGNSLTSKQVI